MTNLPEGVQLSQQWFWWQVWWAGIFIGMPAVAIGMTVWWSARWGRIDLADRPARRALRGRLVGLGVGVTAGMIAWWFYLVTLETPAVIAGYLMGVLFGELLAAPKPSGLVRIASLQPRTGRRYVPRWPARLAVGAGLATAVSPLLFALLPRLHYGSWEQLPAGSASWPGLIISAPLALGAIGVLVAGKAVVGKLVALPPTTPDQPISEQARSNSIRAAVGAVLGIELIFLAYTAFGASVGFHTPYPDAAQSPGWVAAGIASQVLNWSGYALMLAAIVVACALGRWRRPQALRLISDSPRPAQP